MTIWIIATVASGIFGLVLSFKISDFRNFSKLKQIIYVVNVIAFFLLLALSIKDKIDSNKAELAKTLAAEMNLGTVTYPRVYIRNTVTYFDNNGGQVDWREVKGRGDTVHMFRLKTVNGKLFVDHIVRDTYGNIIATIYQNAWKIYNTSDYDYNFDDNALEVITKDHKVLTQLEFKDSAAYFLGYVGLSTGGGMFWGRSSSKFGEAIWVGKGMDLSPYEGNITPLFKYPRELYPGQRVQ